MIDTTPGVNDNNRRPFACTTAIVLWDPRGPAIDGEVMPTDKLPDLVGPRWLWDLVKEPGSRARIAAILSDLIGQRLDRLRASARLPLALTRAEAATTYQVHPHKLKTDISYRYPEIRRITDDVVMRGLLEGAKNLLHTERDVMGRAKNTLRPFPLVVSPFAAEAQGTVGFRLQQEYAMPWPTDIPSWHETPVRTGEEAVA